jgi:hypothetical protein
MSADPATHPMSSLADRVFTAAMRLAWTGATSTARLAIRAGRAALDAAADWIEALRPVSLPENVTGTV